MKSLPALTKIATKLASFLPRWPNLRLHRLKRILPRGLFGRTLLIIVIPSFLSVTVATYVFFNRHWSTVTNRLSQGVAGDIAMVVELLRDAKLVNQKADIVQLADRKLSLYVTFAPQEKLPTRKARFTTPLNQLLQRAIREYVRYPFLVDTRHTSNMIAVRIETPEGLYTILFPDRRIYSPTTEIFIGWMIGSSILLSIIALLFMRNQVRPIRRLAEAAEAIGKGQDVPFFKSSGAIEVRQAAAALFVMQDRVRRQVSQRTTMLAGISHDLRTPLTRMKLQLAMMPDTSEAEEFKSDIADMEMMVESYLAFARGEEAETVSSFDLRDLLDEVVTSLRCQNPDIETRFEGSCPVTLRKNAMKRCCTNLLGNALRYGRKAWIGYAVGEKTIEITIDDDGPGIPAEKREDVFRPFLRLDESRNKETGGVGLGLSIARDIARAHGGDVVLEDNPSQQGLRARIWIPR